MTDASRQKPGLREVYVVWLLFALAAVAVFVTYWRLPPSELWKVTHSGLAGGAGRAFVFLSYSAALAAIAVVAIVVDRLQDRRAAAARDRLGRAVRDGRDSRGADAERPRR